MRKFVGNLQTQKVPFMGKEIEIKKLTAGAVKRIGEATKNNGEEEALSSLVVIFNEAVVLPKGEEPIDTALLEEFPLDELNNLATSIMGFAGVKGNELGNDG